MKKVLRHSRAAANKTVHVIECLSPEELAARRRITHAIDAAYVELVFKAPDLPMGLLPTTYLSLLTTVGFAAEAAAAKIAGYDTWTELVDANREMDPDWDSEYWKQMGELQIGTG